MKKISYYLEKSTDFISQQKYINAIKQSFIDIIPYISGISIIILFLLPHLPQIQNKETITLIYIVLLFSLCFIIAYHYDESQIQSGIKSILVFSLCFSYSKEILHYFPILYLSSLFIPFITIQCKNYVENTLKKYLNIPLLPAVKDVIIQMISIVLILLLGICLSFIPSIFREWIMTFFLIICQIIQSYVCIFLIIILTCLFWIFGIHGVGVLGTIFRPFWLFMILYNILSYLLNLPIPYIGTETFLSWFVWMGGSGCTIGAVLWMRFFAKSHHLKDIGKTSFMSSLCNINEAVIFGLPIVNHKFMRIPFLIVPILCGTLSYFMMSYYLINIPVFIVPWVLPSFIGVFLVCCFDIYALYFCFGLMIMSFIIYSFFLKKYDILLCQEEQQ